jgi:hypothetical protein
VRAKSSSVLQHSSAFPDFLGHDRFRKWDDAMARLLFAGFGLQLELKMLL